MKGFNEEQLNVHLKKTQVIRSVFEDIDDILGAWE